MSNGIGKTWNDSIRICNFCSSKYKPLAKFQKYCSYKCGYDSRNTLKQVKKLNKNLCYRCNSSLLNKRIDAIYCSISCKSMDHTFKHRSKTRFTSTARRVEIIKRDKSICYLCKKLVVSTEINLDHLVPISRGGTSESNNLAVTHSVCNKKRGSRIDIRQLTKLYELRFEVDN